MHKLMMRQALRMLPTLLLTASVMPVNAQTPRRQADFTTGVSDPVVDFINEQIRTGWEDNEVRPSPMADDAEWLRRVHLDIVGRIPSADTVDEFLASRDDAKRARIIDDLLQDPGYVQNWTTVWTNLLLGRQTPQRTSRAGMEKFLRECFSRNRPWNDCVFDLLTAEGHFEENGAVNFLLAQLDGNPNSEDYTVEATARTTRLFLGTQVQCTQCHNHPFNDWKQVQFWEFDSFFKQIRRNNVREFNPETGQNEDLYSELLTREYSGPVYYEKRSGVMEVAYPRYADQEFAATGEVDRREVFAAKLTREDPGLQLARAMVNRTWGHFLGFGFTKPVDDMGPHNPASHPELLDRLAAEFASSGYDLKRLIFWICNSEAYNLSSQFNDDNRVDAPSAGEVPLFSHMYIKPLQAEQLYDSLLVATGADMAGRGGYERAREERNRWLQEFLRIFGGNDNEEPTIFSGSIPQALMMMNSPLVQTALSGEQGTLLTKVLKSERFTSEPLRIRHLYLSALGRNPSRLEASTSLKLINSSRDKWAAYQDLYWALLNSNEFVFNH